MFSETSSSSSSVTSDVTPLIWQSPYLEQAEKFFVDNPVKRVFLPSPSPINEVIVLPPNNEAPSSIPENTLFLSEQRDSSNSDTEGKRTICGSIASPTPSNISSPTKSQKRPITEKNQSIFDKYPASPQTSRKYPLSHQDATSLLSALDLNANTDLLKKFTDAYIKLDDKMLHVGKSLAPGNSATIYLACDQTNSLYAIKFFNIISSVDVEKAKNEAKFLDKLKRLSHPIFYYHDKSSSQHYGIICMPYIQDTIKLSEFLIQKPDLPSNDRCDLALKLRHLVKALHKEDIAHLDLKLENILINPTTRELFLVDFERATQNIDTVAQEHQGSPMYMMPGRFSLTPRQADMVALMRCIFLEASFLTARLVEKYTPKPDESIAIFSATNIPNKLKKILSTSGLKQDGTSQSAKEFTNSLNDIDYLKYHLHAYQLSLEPQQAIAKLTKSGLILESNKFTENQYEYIYATQEHSQKFDPASPQYNETVALLQALRIMAHQYSRSHELDVIKNNPYFEQAVVSAKIPTEKLTVFLQTWHPQRCNILGTAYPSLATYASMWRTSQFYAHTAPNQLKTPEHA